MNVTYAILDMICLLTVNSVRSSKKNGRTYMIYHTLTNAQKEQQNGNADKMIEKNIIKEDINREREKKVVYKLYKRL